MIKSLKLKNFLSFGNTDDSFELRPLNIFIGANGSGKSNFLESFNLLRSTASDITMPMRLDGGVSDWLYKGNKSTSNAVVSFEVENKLPDKQSDLRYTLEFGMSGSRFEIFDEKIESDKPRNKAQTPYIFYDYQGGNPVINELGENNKRNLERKDIDTTKSILVQKIDSIHYPELTFLAQEFSRIKMYREWLFGRNNVLRGQQSADLRSDYLEQDGSNLCVVLSQLRLNSSVKNKLLNELQNFYGDVIDYDVHTSGGACQLFFSERGLNNAIPATRLSDGTLRYLFLLAILCHSEPPPLVCIEEPELGMHPDIIPSIAKLLREASTRCQLIVTTHSEKLISAFTDTPESVIVVEKDEDGTSLDRLSKKELEPWLKEYSLGKLWSKGNLGGNRW